MTEKIQHIASAWKGLEGFAVKLVESKNPEVTVELGVDYGFSTFAFALPNRGKVYGIDWFKGDEHAGKRNTYDYVTEQIAKLNLTNVVLIKSDFSEAAKMWDKKIDILHIDGVHHYHSVKENFYDWVEFVKEDGVILMHDTVSFRDTVGKFFSEIDMPKYNIEHSNGLGIVARSYDVLNAVVALTK